MLTHSIAGLKIGIEYSYPKMKKQCARYITDNQRTDFNIETTQELLEGLHRVTPQFSVEECEYMYTGTIFYRMLLEYNGMMLHSSAVVKDGYAYLFSAPSGTGKSTHTSLWKEIFEDAEILNDDKPAIRIIDGKAMAFGTPWSGKTDISINKCVPVGGICFLERAKENRIHKISSVEAIPLILNQTERPKTIKNIDKMLGLIEKLVENVNVYKLGCNISHDAARLAYETMKKENF